MKRILLLCCLLLIVLQVQAQPGSRRTTIPPPPSMKVPAPPKPVRSYEEMKAREADPMDDRPVAFRTAEQYRKTDTAFLAVHQYFAPSGWGMARISTSVASYPESYTIDSLPPPNHYIALSYVTTTRYQEGHYRYSGKYPRECGKLIFTDDATKKKSVFKIIWKGKGRKRSILALQEEGTATRWEATEPPAAPPVMSAE